MWTFSCSTFEILWFCLAGWGAGNYRVQRSVPERLGRWRDMLKTPPWRLRNCLDHFQILQRPMTEVKTPSVSQTRGVPCSNLAVEVSKTDAWELPRFTTLGAEPSLILVSLCFLQFEHVQHVKQRQTHIVSDRKTSNSHQFSLGPFPFKDLKTFINFPSSRIKTYHWSPSGPRWRSTPWYVNCNSTRKSWPTWRSEQCQTPKNPQVVSKGPVPSGFKKPVCNVFFSGTCFKVDWCPIMSDPFFSRNVDPDRRCQEHAGHRNFEVSRELIAAVKESNSNRCDAILWLGTGEQIAHVFPMSSCHHLTQHCPLTFIELRRRVGNMFPYMMFPYVYILFFCWDWAQKGSNNAGPAFCWYFQ